MRATNAAACRLSCHRAGLLMSHSPVIWLMISWRVTRDPQRTRPLCPHNRRQWGPAHIHEGRGYLTVPVPDPFVIRPQLSVRPTGPGQRARRPPALARSNCVSRTGASGRYWRCWRSMPDPRFKRCASGQGSRRSAHPIHLRAANQLASPVPEGAGYTRWWAGSAESVACPGPAQSSGADGGCGF